MVTRADQALLEAVQQNTIAVQRLVEQMATIQYSREILCQPDAGLPEGGAGIAAGNVENLAT